jgi:hypothetical protein
MQAWPSGSKGWSPTMRLSRNSRCNPHSDSDMALEEIFDPLPPPPPTSGRPTEEGFEAGALEVVVDLIRVVCVG